MNKKTIDFKLFTNINCLDAFDRVVVKVHLKKIQSQDAVYLVCGTDPKVGSTMTARHIAAGIAKIGKKVLYLDADMKKLREKKNLREDYKSGLDKYLTEEVAYEDVIYRTSIPTLDVIPASKKQESVQLLCSKKMEELIEALKQEYEFIIIDAPSMGASSDAAAILGYVEQVILVVAPERSFKKQLIKCRMEIQKYGSSLLGVVVNRVDKYGYSDYMKNGDYYHEKKTKRGLEKLIQKIFSREKKHIIK